MPFLSVNNTMTYEDADQYHDAIGEPDQSEITAHRANSTPMKPPGPKTSHGGTLSNMLDKLNPLPSASS